MKYKIKYLGGMSNTLKDNSEYDDIINIIPKIDNISKEINEIKDSLSKYSSLQKYGLQKYEVEGNLYNPIPDFDNTVKDLFYRRLPRDNQNLSIDFNRIAIQVASSGSFHITALYYSKGNIEQDVKDKLIKIYTNVVEHKNIQNRKKIEGSPAQSSDKLYLSYIKENDKRLKDNIERINTNTGNIWFPLGEIYGDIYIKDTTIISKIKKFYAFNLPRSGGNHMLCFYISYLRNKYPGKDIKIVLINTVTGAYDAYNSMGFELLKEEDKKNYKEKETDYKNENDEATHILNIDEALRICEKKSFTKFSYYEK